jgi:hypothetical protein
MNEGAVPCRTAGESTVPHDTRDARTFFSKTSVFVRRTRFREERPRIRRRTRRAERGKSRRSESDPRGSLVEVQACPSLPSMSAAVTAFAADRDAHNNDEMGCHCDDPRGGPASPTMHHVTTMKPVRKRGRSADGREAWPTVHHGPPLPRTRADYRPPRPR